jgi:L-asparaginase
VRKTILILNTGGTICSVKTTHGYEPIKGGMQPALQMIPTLSHEDMPRYLIKEYEPLIDSSNVTPREWNRLASDIAAHYDEVDGFVIFHGTDTMAYTASALSFMLENLGKPVILTGSQIPLSEVRNDAMDNVITSLWLAAHEPIFEVCIYFNQHLLRGNRAQKVSSSRFNAFDSPNDDHLATVGIDIVMRKDRLLPAPVKPFHYQALHDHRMANFRLFPGFSMDVLHDLLKQPLDALVFETYGTGNAPNYDPSFLSMLQEACQRGMLIVNCSQCQHGSVEMSQYATGSTLKKAGLLSGFDMTPEAVHCKLLYLLSKYKDKQQIKQKLEENLVGELSAVLHAE